MSVLQALLLGIVQGVSEFLPISSSGHLIIVQHLLDVRGSQILFDITVHVGTLVAVLVAMREEVRQALEGVAMWRTPAGRRDPRARLAAWLVLATLPAGIAGVALSGEADRLFGSPRVAGVGLLVTGAVLAAASRARRGGAGLFEVGLPRSLVTGVAQAIAIVPGISRSGMTIGAGVLAGVDRRDAARFSFLLSVPTIAGAGLLGAYEGVTGGAASPGGAALAAGFAGAALSGYVAIRWLLFALRGRNLAGFALYVVVVGVLVLWKLPVS